MARSFRLLVAAALLSFSSFAAGAQSMAESGSAQSVPLAKLCMPVTYRQYSFTEAPKAKVGILGDRYQELLQALSGWNESGVPLTGKISGHWVPVPCGDDTGLFYIVPLLSRATGLSAGASLDCFLLGFIAFSAVAGFIGIYLAASRPWQRFLSLAPLLAGSLLSYKFGDVYVIQPSLVLMLVPWLIYALSSASRLKRRYLILFLAGVLLGFGQWIRTQSATAMVIFFLVLLLADSSRPTVKVLSAFTLFVGASLPLLYARMPIYERDKFLAVHEDHYQPALNRHVLWHTTYLGLAFLTNPYVRAWQDQVAVDYVKSVDPAAIYGSAEYETALRLRVQQIARHNPRFIFTTLAAKAGVLACIFLLSANIGVAAALFSPKPLALEVAFWSAMVVAAAPGMIALPAPQYVLGLIALAFYYCYYSVLFYVERKGSLPMKPMESQLNVLLATYPRAKPALSGEHQESYVEHYRSNRAGKQGLSRVVAKLESWMHRRVAQRDQDGYLLELGAGNLNHLPYLPQTCVCDAVEPFADLWRDSPYRSRIRRFYSDIQEIPLDAKYDCIFSIAVLEHLEDLPLTLARAGLLLREGGSFRAGFPSEGGLLWGLGWRLTTALEYRLKRGLDYGAIMRHEHLNTADEIIALLRHFYDRVEISRFPAPFHHLSFYVAVYATKPLLERCHAYERIRSGAKGLVHG